MFNARRATKLLKALGNTSEEVAASLAEKGVKGWVGTGARCPIANFLKANAVKFEWVSSSRLHFSEDLLGPTISVPPAVRHFISDFDRGQYREQLYDFEGLRRVGGK